MNLKKIRGVRKLTNKLISFLVVLALIIVILSGVAFVKNKQKALVASNTNTGVTNNNTNNNTGMTGMTNNNNTNITPTNNMVEGFNDHSYANGIVKPKAGQPIKKFNLLAQETDLKLSSDITLTGWTYNGTAPGPEIRVNQGDFVEVTLRNSLKDPVTIHWHGYPLNSSMDGIPGVTQDAVRAGESFTYMFSADTPGTYWYHSHQEGSKQVDKGLYGALIVEPKVKEKIDKDYTLILDEWVSDPKNAMDMSSSSGSNSSSNMAGMSNSSSSTKSSGMSSSSSSTTSAGMDMGKPKVSDPVMDEENAMAYSYDLYTVNGKSGDLIKPLEVKKGDRVRLRLINAGYRSHGMHIPGQDIKVVSTDGQDITGPGTIKDKIIMIAPGERYDVEFTVTSSDNFVIDAHDDNAYNDQLRIPVNVIGGSGNAYVEPDGAEYKVFDLTTYSTDGKGEFTLDQKYDKEYNLELNTRVDNGKLSYTINGKTFMESQPLQVKTGDTVELTFDNKSKIDHPMHLHGHFFQILSKNGKPVTGAGIMKDTLNIKPGEKYVVAFKANNPGDWALHCHELHHAAAGMMTLLEYTDYTSNYKPNPNNTYNKAE